MPVPFRPGTLPVFQASRGTHTAPKVLLANPSSARTTGGTSITITGRDFTVDGAGNPPIVLFGALPATNVVVVDRETITCDSPVSTEVGTVSVTVTTIGGSDTLQSGFQFFSSTITRVTGPTAYGTIAGGYERMLEGFNFIDGSTISFGGVPVAASTFIDEQHYLVTVPPHGAGFVSVQITDPAAVTFELTNGFQYTLLIRGNDFRRQPGIQINDTLGEAPNTLDVTIDGNSNKPLVGEEIEYVDSHDGNRLLFRGTVLSVNQEYEELTSQLIFPTRAVDFTFLLNKYRPFGSYRLTSASDIVIDLIQRFAPEFTTEFVQTNLARVSMDFNGTRTLNQCLTDLGQSIGGGHWYVDYERRVHFFHIVPSDVRIPELPEATVSPATLTPMVVTEGAGIPTTDRFEPGWYVFRQTFQYSNNAESVLGPMSTPVFLDGAHIISFANVQTGPTVGSLTVGKRRIYANRLIAPHKVSTKWDTPYRFLQVADNVTTAFTVYKGQDPSGNGSPVGGSVASIENIPGSEPIPTKSFTNPPPGPEQACTVRVNFGNNDSVLQTPGNSIPSDVASGWGYRAKVAFLYQDGSVSFVGKESNYAHGFFAAGRNPDYGRQVTWTGWINGVAVTGTKLMGYSIDDIDIGNIPTGPDVNGVPCIARLIFVAQGYSIGGGSVFGYDINFDFHVDQTTAVLVVPDNTSSELTDTMPFGNIVSRYGDTSNQFSQLPFGSRSLVGRPNAPTINGPAQQEGPGLEPDPIPIWPNPDGPWLEDTDKPDDITDAALAAGTCKMLMNPPLSSSVDMSQLRNRIFVKGRGSTVTSTTPIGSMTLPIADGNAFTINGGRVLCGDKFSVAYTGVGGSDGAYYLSLAEGLQDTLREGDVVQNFFEANDEIAQRDLGQIELTRNGVPSDGVHEYTVVDTTLKTPFQLYMRAFAEIELFSRPIVTVRYATRDPNSRSGKIVHIDISNPPLKGDFLIQSVGIDQIHDEADETLMPRYNVVASSVRFNLDDLLLRILDQDHGFSASSGSSIGVGAAAVAGTTIIQSSARTFTREVWGGIISGGATPSYWTTLNSVVGLAVASTGGSGTYSFDTTEIPPFPGNGSNGANDGPRLDWRWATLTSNVSTGSASGWAISSSIFGQLEYDPTLIIRIKTSSVKNVRIFAGLSNISIAGATNDELTNASGVRFRYSSGVDSGWTACVQKGGVANPRTVKAIAGAGIAANTEYILQLRVVNRGKNLYFSVNGGAETMVDGANVPLGGNIISANQMGLIVSMNTKTNGTAKKLNFHSFSVSCANP